MKGDPSSAQLIITQAKVERVPNTYSIGCYARRVTFYSQQNRALNLIWALFEKSKITSNSSVAIVGGGLAGMSAAVAAMTKGCKVTLFEAEEDLMPIQRGNTTRYIHPNIYDWPSAGSEENETDLPFLNWKAGNTDEVIHQIEKEWELYCDGIEIQKSTLVNSVIDLEGMPVVLCNTGVPLKFDCVILGIGFGEERPLENVAMTLYWTTDGLHQRPMGGSTKNYLVSGCGDGGLIDTLRLTIKNFDHKSFTEKFIAAGFPQLYAALLAIDEAAPSEPAKASFFLFGEYSKLTTPPDIKQFISANLRNNTKVTLNGRTPTFMTTQSSILNRYAVFLIMEAGKISYKHGEVSVTKKDNKSSVTIKNNISYINEEFDDVVVRHGPKAVIGKLTGQEAPHYDSDKTDVTAKKLWPDTFFVTESKAIKTIQPKVCNRDSAFQYYDELKTSLMGFKYFSCCFVGGTETSPEYLVNLTSKTLPKPYKDYQEFKGIPIIYNFEQKFKFSMSTTPNILGENISLFEDVLHSGMPIRNKDLKSGITGTLSCFVITPLGMPAILCTSHVLAPNGENAGVIVANGLGGTNEKIVADLSFGVRLFSRKGPKSLQTNVNLIDAAVAILRPRIEFSTMVPLPDGTKIYLKGVTEAALDQKVFKYSIKNGLTTGRITAVRGTVMVEYAKVKRLFNEVLMVESINDRPFSESGDSGSLVYNAAGFAIGIVFAMSNKISIVCPLPSILKELNCTLFV
jgi:hypothetical protein